MKSKTCKTAHVSLVWPNVLTTHHATPYIPPPPSNPSSANRQFHPQKFHSLLLRHPYEPTVTGDTSLARPIVPNPIFPLKMTCFSRNPLPKSLLSNPPPPPSPAAPTTIPQPLTCPIFTPDSPPVARNPPFPVSPRALHQFTFQFQLQFQLDCHVALRFS